MSPRDLVNSLLTNFSEVDHIIIAVDGGHVHDMENKGKNFEAMVSKAYNPKNVVRTDKHHTKIVEKHCTGSAKYDQQDTMIRLC